MQANNNWSRRKFSKAVLSLQALIVSGALGINAGCASDGKKDQIQPLGKATRKRLLLAMDEIIPASNKMPAASEVGTLEYILKVLEGYPEFLSAFEEILTHLNDFSNITADQDFENLSSDSRISVLQQFEKDQPDSFSVLLNFVYEGYYINEKVWALIGYEPYPTMSAGPKMEAFDESMLERVKKMTEFYIKT